MSPEEIKIELFKRRRQVTMASIGRSLDPECTRTAVKRVIERGFVSNRIMEAVADAIDMSKEQVFPEYYLKKNKLNYRT